MVPIAKISTTKAEIAVPVVNMTRRSEVSVFPSSAKRSSGIPSAPIAAKSSAVEAAAAAMPTSRAEKRCVETAQ